VALAPRSLVLDSCSCGWRECRASVAPDGRIERGPDARSSRRDTPLPREGSRQRCSPVTAAAGETSAPAGAPMGVPPRHRIGRPPKPPARTLARSPAQRRGPGRPTWCRHLAPRGRPPHRPRRGGARPGPLNRRNRGRREAGSMKEPRGSSLRPNAPASGFARLVLAAPHDCLTGAAPPMPTFGLR
jgi:hypothetical protein